MEKDNLGSGRFFPQSIGEKRYRSDSHGEHQAWISDEGNMSGPRKKFRPSQDQLSVLEHVFNNQTYLRAGQKEQLAKMLNMQTLQVEYWFQNRRARSKVTKTENEYEILKKCCERVSYENQWLKRELRELRADSQNPPYLFELQKITSMSPSREAAIKAGTKACKSVAAEPNPPMILQLGWHTDQ